MKSLRLTEADYAAILARKGAKAPAKPVAERKSKYGNRKTEVDGITFDSAKEAKRYQVLRLMEKGRLITSLRCQVPYPLEINGTVVATYIADFVYRKATKMEFSPAYDTVVEDCKGVRTPVYRLKAKLMLAIHGITIRET